METENNPLNPKLIGLIALTLIIGVVGGYVFGTSELQPIIDELKQNNTELVSHMEDILIKYTDLQDNLTLKDNELTNYVMEISSLREEVDIYADDVQMLQDEVNRVKDLYEQLQVDYQLLSLEYDNLTFQSRYKLIDIFLREDMYISYNLPTRVYTSPDFTLAGETTKFDYSIWCDQASSSSSAQIRVYKAGTSIRVYNQSVKLKEEPNLELYYAEGSFSIVLNKGNYYLTIVLEDASLSPAPIYQSNIHIWDYY